MTLLQCKDVKVNIDGATILDSINLTIEKNTSYVILGRSGSGKTTLLNALSGLLQISSGNITHLGKPLSGLCPNMSYVFQKNNLFPWKTIEENLMLSLVNTPLTRNQKNSRIHSILEELNLSKHMKKYPSRLSEGERQRAAIARALITEPQLLLMDEPTSSLDALSKESFQIIIQRLLRSHPTSLVMVTHDIEEAIFLGQNIIIVSDGRISSILKSQDLGKADRSSLDFYKQCISLRDLLCWEEKIE